MQELNRFRSVYVHWPVPCDQEFHGNSNDLWIPRSKVRQLMLVYRLNFVLRLFLTKRITQTWQTELRSVVVPGKKMCTCVLSKYECSLLRRISSQSYFCDNVAIQFLGNSCIFGRLQGC